MGVMPCLRRLKALGYVGFTFEAVSSSSILPLLRAIGQVADLSLTRSWTVRLWRELNSNIFFVMNPTSWQDQGQGWNFMFVGDVNPPNGDGWPSTHNTVVAKTPVVREKPHLTVDSSNNYSVVVPLLKNNSQGPSWTPSSNNTGTNLTPSTTLPLSDFYVAQASQDNANTINIALQRNMHLLLTPGYYNLSEPIVVRNPNTVVLGLGLATLSPMMNRYTGIDSCRCRRSYNCWFDFRCRRNDFSQSFAVWRCQCQFCEPQRQPHGCFRYHLSRWWCGTVCSDRKLRGGQQL